MSSSDEEDLQNEAPTSINPYEILELERDATEAQVKTAYRKAALKSHPDKVAPEKRQEAHETFQRVAFAYAILSDPARRKRYDITGSTAESIVDSDNFNWSDFYRAQFQDAVSADAIARFAAKYRHSTEEADDVLASYEVHCGDLDALYETVILSDVREDDERFRAIIDEAIRADKVPAFPAYTKETKKKRAARLKAAKNEASEAKAYAKELGVHDKLFGTSATNNEDEDENEDDDMPVSNSKSSKPSNSKEKAALAKGKKKKASSEDALAALIRSRQQQRSGFLDALEAKYTAKEAKKGGKFKAGKRSRDEEGPSEEEFLAIQCRLDSERKSGRAKRARSNQAPHQYLCNLNTILTLLVLSTLVGYYVPINTRVSAFLCPSSRCHAMTSEPAPFYPRYCFELSPTFSAWCFLKITDTRSLVQRPEYEGQNFFFYRNLPIRWVRFVGLVVSITQHANRCIYALDDSSGDVLQAVLWSGELKNDGDQVHNKDKPTNWPSISPGLLVDAKGELIWYRDVWQLRLTKFTVVPDIAAEMVLWNKRLAFRREVLSMPWLLSDKEVKRAQRQAEREEQLSKDSVAKKGDKMNGRMDGVDWDEVERLMPSKTVALKVAWRKLEDNKRAELLRHMTIELAKYRQMDRKKRLQSGVEP
ncbi:hypothetical protein BROUX41_003443 [Berkeleyomyces rouxiae]|uniref:uncharacterized protein n=1 Tax=Berkeleyomyces rouxiae TaxID=2035830 RepID=UPI003B820965